MSKKRISKQQLKNLHKIENLLDKANTQYKSNNVTIQEKPAYCLRVKDKEIPCEHISVSEHCRKRAIERLGLKRTSEQEVDSFIHKMLDKSEYIGRVTASDDNEGEMFVTNGIIMYLSLELDNVITVYKIDRMKNNPILTKIRDLMMKEFRKLDRTERARIRQLGLMELEVQAEISELKLRAYKSRSQAVKMAVRGRIQALEMRLSELKEEVKRIKSEKKQIAVTIASVY